MDPILCCVLGICCPPLQRRQTVVAHYVTMGLGVADAERCADDLIGRVDRCLATGLGAMLKQVVAHGKGQKE